MARGFAVVLAIALVPLPQLGPAAALADEDLAQEGPAPFEPGARLRLTFPCGLERPLASGEPERDCRLEGRLVAVRGDTVTLANAEATRSHRLGALDRVEVSRRSGSRWLAGAGAGFVVGAGSTFLLLNRGGSTSTCDSSANQDAAGTGACLGLAALGGVAGAVLGGLIGKLVRTEDWQEVPADRVRVSLGPQAGVGFRVALAVSF